MSESNFEFIRIKEELLHASQFLNEHLHDYESYNPLTFANQLLTIQSKFSTLCGLSKVKKRDLNKLKSIANDLILLSSDIQTAKNGVDRAYKIGILAGSSAIYLNEVNSVAHKTA